MITNVLDYLDESSRKYPDKVGYADPDKELTFGELKKQVNSIGTYLAKYINKGEPVAIYLDKGVDSIAAFLGVAAAGGFYAPIDISMPIHRVSSILNTLETKVILTNKKGADQLKEIDFNGSILFMEESVCEEADDELLSKIRGQMIDSDPLYSIFTSGSTGVPKGVLTSQRSAINFTEWYCNAFDFSDTEIFGNQTPFYFDASVKDIYATLRCGATMHIIPKSLFSFPAKLIEYLNERKINCIDWVPSALCIIVNFNTFEKVKPLYLKKVMFLGEVMPTKQFNMWRKELPDIQYANLYGPTEATGDCTYYKVEREISNTESIPIGKACENTEVLILKEDGTLAEKNETGEICVRGTSLALGYYNNQEKTDEVFVPNPLQKHYRELIYKTGDLGYYNDLDEIIYVSRKDNQIKHMGHRIELGEIETAIGAVDGIRRVCCLYHKAKEKIVAVYEGDIDRKEIINQIKTNLPKYMIPNIYKQVDSIPINLNGKIDRVLLTKEFIDGED